MTIGWDHRHHPCVRLLLAVFACVPLASLWSGTAGAVYAPNTAESAAQNLASCVQQNGKLAVELLIDQTASLEYGDNGVAGHGPGTDPTGKRVVLAQSVVQALAQVQAITGGVVNVQVAGFGTGVDPVSVNGPSDWNSVSNATMGPIVAALEQFRNRDSDVNTDYVTALTTANQNLQQERQAMGGQACTAILLFTDGAFSFNPGATPSWYGPVSTAEANNPNSDVYAQGIKDLCGPDGIMNSLRDYDPPVFVFAAGLAPTPSPSGPPQNFSLLQGLATGSAVPGFSSCGTPNATGAFINGNVNQLSSDIISGLVGGASGVATCSGTDCSASFQVYPYTKSALLDVTTNEPGQLTVLGPDGRSIAVPAVGSSEGIDGVNLTTTISNLWPGQTNPGDQWLLNLSDFPAATSSQPATWELEFSPTPSPSPPEMSLQDNVVSGLQLVPERITIPWKRGGDGSSAYQLTDGTIDIPAGLVASSNLTGNVNLNGSVTSVPVVEVDQSNQFELHLPSIAPSTTATAANVTISGPITMKSGEVVQIALVPPPIPIVAPHGPQPAPMLQFGLLQAKLSQTRNPKGVQPTEPLEALRALPVSAAVSGPGTFCIRSTAGITEAGTLVAVRPQSGNCRHLVAGQQGIVPLTLRIQRPLSGKLTGSIVATTRWRYGTVSYTWTIPVAGTVVVPPASPIVDQKTLWVLVIGSVIGAALLWFLMCWWTAVLSSKTRKIQHYAVNAVLDATTNQAIVRFDSPGQEDFVFVHMPNNHTRTALSLGLELKAPIRVLRPQDVVVGQAGAIVNGTLGSAGGRNNLKGRIEHRIQGQWVFCVSMLDYVAPDAKVIDGTLHYFVLEDAAGTESRPGGLLDDIRKDLPLQYERICARASRLTHGRPPQSTSDSGSVPVDEEKTLW